MVVTRFAPSPNGSLHLGHAYSAIAAHDIALKRQGRFLLRIEDIDGARSLPEKAAEFRADLAWLGLSWEEVPAQSTRLASYARAAKTLSDQGYLYACTCTRKQVAAHAVRSGPDGPVYSGRCKGRSIGPDEPHALRLDTARVMVDISEIFFEDEINGKQIVDLSRFGDVVLVRKDAPASYHLAATLDDAADGVTLVTRGQDLFQATRIHRALQELLGLPVPMWHHHPILIGADGEKLAKRRGSPSLADRRRAGEDGRALAECLRAGQFPAGITLASA